MGRIPPCGTGLDYTISFGQRMSVTCEIDLHKSVGITKCVSVINFDSRKQYIKSYAMESNILNLISLIENSMFQSVVIHLKR